MKLLKQAARSVIIRTGRNILWSLDKMLARASTIGAEPFFDPTQFDWVPMMESNWLIIRRELQGILASNKNIPNFQEISTDQKKITNDDRWKTYFLYGYGYKSEKNCSRCPETTEIIERIPGMHTAFFSILYPHKHISEHRGLYKGFIRYHLGLIVPKPEDSCRIRVGDRTAYWEEGKSMIFDDTYPHEAWNDSDAIRVVLFLNIVRPLSFPMSVINKTVINLIRMSPYVQDARKRQERWESLVE